MDWSEIMVRARLHYFASLWGYPIQQADILSYWGDMQNQKFEKIECGLVRLLRIQFYIQTNPHIRI